MKIKILFSIIFVLGTLVWGYSQSHDRLCEFHGGPHEVVMWDADYCPVCRKENKEKKEKYEAWRKERNRLDAIRKENEERAAEEYRKMNAKHLQDLEEEKKTIEYGKGMNTESKNMDNILKASQKQRDQVNEKYRQADDQRSKEYMASLERIQNARAQKASPDGYWDETVEVANYVPVRKNNDGWYGYANKAGDLKIDYQYNYARPFYKGVAAVNKSGWQIINAQGKILTTLDRKISRVDTFFDGVAAVSQYEYTYDVKDYFGAIDYKGNVIIPLSFNFIGRFKNGTAYAVKLVEEHSENVDGEKLVTVKYYIYEDGLIDKSGNWIETPRRTYNVSASWSWLRSDNQDIRSWYWKVRKDEGYTGFYYTGPGDWGINDGTTSDLQAMQQEQIRRKKIKEKCERLGEEQKSKFRSQGLSEFNLPYKMRW